MDLALRGPKTRETAQSNGRNTLGELGGDTPEGRIKSWRRMTNQIPEVLWNRAGPILKMVEWVFDTSALDLLQFVRALFVEP